MAKFYTGRDGSLLLDGVTQAKVTSWSFSSDLETLETTTLGESRAPAAAQRFCITKQTTVATTLATYSKN